MNAWFVICPERRVPGLWGRWLKEACVAIGWGPPRYKLLGPTNNPRWNAARRRALRVKAGDVVLPYLQKYRIGVPGRVVRVAISDQEWRPTAAPGEYKGTADLGRRIEVEWLTRNVPPLNMIVRVPERYRKGTGFARKAIEGIRKKERFFELMQIVSDTKNWVLYEAHQNQTREGDKSKNFRNPKWAREELILALEVYLKHRSDGFGKNHPDVIELSKILNRLAIHQDRPDAERFRNPNAVYMKLCNFLRFDSTYEGKGLQRGGADEERIWNEFVNDRLRLAAVAADIRAGISQAGHDRKYWAVAANPRIFRVHQLLADGVRECSWIVKSAPMNVGDRVVVWKAKGNEDRRGIVALAEVISPPAVREIVIDKYWAAPKNPGKARSVILQFVLPQSIPLWVGEGHDALLQKLSVARATGGGVFKVTAGQWNELLNVLGGWPDAEDEEAAIVETVQTFRERKGGQGFGGSSKARKAIERYAVERAIRHFEAKGFSVREVGKPYDLHCTSGNEELFVEVKGTCTSGDSVLLTRNEVSFYRQKKPRVALYVCTNVRVREKNGETEVFGGAEQIYQPWDVDAGELEPMAFEYWPPVAGRE